MITPGVVLVESLRVDSETQADGTHAESYVLSAQAGQTYTVWLASEDLDTVLFVFDSSDEPIAVDDDGYFGTNSTISFTPNFAGNYRIVASSYSPGSTGTFRLFVSAGGSYSPVTDPLPPGPVSASLDNSDALGLETGWQTDYYLLEPTRLGELVTLTLRSAALDSKLFVVDSDGRILVSDDDSAGGRDARVTFPWTPAPEQQFFAVVTSAEPGQYGGYFLERVDGATAPAPAPAPVPTPTPTPAVAPDPVEPAAVPPVVVPAPVPTTVETVRAQPTGLEVGSHVEAQLAVSDGGGRRAGPVDAYDIHIATEALLQLDARSEDFDTYLQIYDERGDLIAEDDDSGRRTDSRIVVELQAGDYVAEVSTFDGEGSGSYEVGLAEAELLTDPDEIRIGSEIDGRWTVRHPLDDVGHRVARYEFRAPRSQMITILLRTQSDRTFCALEMTGERGRFDERSVRIDDGCVIVANVDAGERYDLLAIGSRHDDDTEYLLALSAQDPAIRWESIGLNRNVRGHIAWSSPFTEWNAPAAGFVFNLDYGDRVSIHVSSTELDARAYVTDMDGTLIASSMDSRDLLSGSGLQFTAERSGSYRLYVTGRQRWFDTFTLRIDRTPGG